MPCSTGSATSRSVAATVCATRCSASSASRASRIARRRARFSSARSPVIARVSRANTSSSDWLFSRIFLRRSPVSRRSLNSSSAICSAVSTATACVSTVRVCFCTSRILPSTNAATCLTQRSSSSVLRAYLTPAICTVTERFIAGSIDLISRSVRPGASAPLGLAGQRATAGGAAGYAAETRAPPAYADSPVSCPFASHQRQRPSRSPRDVETFHRGRAVRVPFARGVLADAGEVFDLARQVAVLVPEAPDHRSAGRPRRSRRRRAAARCA